jgi:hypothetical protein
MAFFCHVSLKAGKEHRWSDATTIQSVPDIEQISSLFSLIKRSELGGEQFIEPIGRNVGGSAEPGVLDFKGYAYNSELGEMFTGVDFDLESMFKGWGVLGFKPIYQVGSALFELTAGLPEPGIQNRTSQIEGLADWLRSDLD